MKIATWCVMFLWLGAAACAVQYKDYAFAVAWFGGFLILLKKI